jgi:hypothetical protein
MVGLACVAMAALASCGNPRETRLPETGATLEGTVTYKGDQLQFAQIQVLGEGRMATGRIGEDGRYRVENCPLGQVKVGVNTAAARGEYTSKTMQGGVYKGPEAKGKGRVDLKFMDVPAKFADPEKSELSTSVREGTNTYDIDIK